MNRYIEVYKNIVHPFFPAVVTLDTFETSLFTFLERRPALGNDSDFKQNIDPSWLSLLFAVLACGVQFSDDQIKERDLRSKVFSMSLLSSLHGIAKLTIHSLLLLPVPPLREYVLHNEHGPGPSYGACWTLLAK